MYVVNLSAIDQQYMYTYCTHVHVQVCAMCMCLVGAAHSLTVVHFNLRATFSVFEGVSGVGC